MPEIPEGAKVPGDRKKKSKKDAEQPQLIEFDYEGQHYAIDRENANNLELMEFTEEGKYILAIRGYLGADQWAKWKDANRDEKDRVNSDAFEPFLNAVMVAIGGGEEKAPNS